MHFVTSGFVTAPDHNYVQKHFRIQEEKPAEQQLQALGRKGRFASLADDSKSKLTLGGLLNFADGLRSSCGSERIFIFTTNHPERLDPALVRPGRMDLHIHLSYCTFDGFKTLCKTYLGLSQHPLLDRIKAVLTAEKKLTPADISAILDAGRGDHEGALQQVLARCKLAPVSAELKQQVDTAANGELESRAEKLQFGQGHDGPILQEGSSRQGLQQ